MADKQLGAGTSLKLCAVKVGDQRTSIRLEPELWDALHDIGRRERLTRAQLLAFIASRRSGSSLSSAVRVFISTYYWELSETTRGQVRAMKMPSTHVAMTGWVKH